MTEKFTTGSPDFIETGHMEQAAVDEKMLKKIKDVVSHALTSLGIKYGASHSELKISKDGDIKLIEIGGRMGGDNIGAALVELSTGYDFLGAVLDVALGIEPKYDWQKKKCAGIRFIFGKEDIECLERLKEEHSEILIDENVRKITDEKIIDSGSRFGYFIFASYNREIIEHYLPKQMEE